MFISKRDLVLNIILTIVTCGLWGIVWEVQIADDIKLLTGEEGLVSGIVLVLLSLVTCGIYFIFWVYNAGNKLELVKAGYGLPTESKGLVYVVLSIFGFSIVALALMQNDLNTVADINLNKSGNMDNVV
jgi:hypothetical protein